MTVQSFVSKLVSKGSVPIYFITCQTFDNRDCHYYIISTPEKMRMYESIRTGKFDLNDYGTIIARGYGKTPSEYTKKMLKEEYGVTVQ